MYRNDGWDRDQEQEPIRTTYIPFYCLLVYAKKRIFVEKIKSLIEACIYAYVFVCGNDSLVHRYTQFSLNQLDWIAYSSRTFLWYFCSPNSLSDTISVRNVFQCSNVAWIVMATVELDRNSLDFSIFHLKIKTFYTKRGLNSSTYFSQYTLVFTSFISCRTSSSNRKPFFIVAFS